MGKGLFHIVGGDFGFLKVPVIIIVFGENVVGIKNIYTHTYIHTHTYIVVQKK